MSVELVRSPWLDELRELASIARHRLTVVAPYISISGWRLFKDSITRIDDVRLEVCTSLDPEAVAEGFLDLSVLVESCNELPKFRLRHIPRLHAKVYIADSNCAIVSSGNLTMSSLTQNKEYGVRVSDRESVEAIQSDVSDYAALGAVASCTSLREIAVLGSRIKEARAERLANEGLDEAVQRFDHRVRSLRGEQDESTNAILMRTILYLLAEKPMKTEEMHPLVQSIHPDLCDDNVDRVINGISFGRKWKHNVRNAQVVLRRQERIGRDTNGLWHLL